MLELTPDFDLVRYTVTPTVAAGQSVQVSDLAADVAGAGLVPLQPADVASWAPVDPTWRTQYDRWRDAVLVYVVSTSGSVAQTVPVAGREFWLNADTSTPATPVSPAAPVFGRCVGRGAGLQLLGASLIAYGVFSELPVQALVLGLVDTGTGPGLALPRARWRVRLMAQSNNSNTRELASEAARRLIAQAAGGSG